MRRFRTKLAATAAVTLVVAAVAPALASADRITVSYNSSTGSGFCNIDSWLSKSTTVLHRYVESNVGETCVGATGYIGLSERSTYLNETSALGDREVARRTGHLDAPGSSTSAIYTTPLNGALYHSTADVALYGATKNGFAWTASTRPGNCVIFPEGNASVIWCYGLNDSLVY